jgi:hypothetical protein
MAHEQFIAELAALREKHTLDEVIELVLEGLGGRDKVDAELDARDGVEGDDDGEDTPDPLIVMRDADVARLETIQGMAESFCTWLHAKGEAQMKQDTDEAVDKVQQLSASFNKAARAVRLSMVLKHEVAGLRPLPQSRAPAGSAGPANENAAPKGGTGTRRVRGDWPDNADEAQAEYEDSQKKLAVYMRKLSDALDIDIAAAPPEIQAEAKRESMAVKLTSIAASIPHPTLDRTIADIQMGYLWDSFAPRYATKPEALGPPDPERLNKHGWNGVPQHRTRTARSRS